MFKVSFKENPKFPVKKVQRIEHTRETIVTLRGTACLPVFMQYYIPPVIWDWVESCKNVQAEFSMTKIYLTVKGKAKRNEDDADNPILGERIAEARAKLALYKFMATLCHKLFKYYNKVLFGEYVKVKVPYSDTLYAAYVKYIHLWDTELDHLQKLLTHESDTESTSQS